MFCLHKKWNWKLDWLLTSEQTVSSRRWWWLLLSFHLGTVNRKVKSISRWWFSWWWLVLPFQRASKCYHPLIVIDRDEETYSNRTRSETATGESLGNQRIFSPSLFTSGIITLQFAASCTFENRFGTYFSMRKINTISVGHTCSIHALETTRVISIISFFSSDVYIDGLFLLQQISKVVEIVPNELFS